MTVRQRHGCLTAWLIFMIVASSISALANLYFGINPKLLSNLNTQQGISNVSSATFVVLAIISVLNVTCAVALLRWKKWGFYGILGISVVTFIINLSIGINIVSALMGFIGIAILYGVLNMGGENKAWGRLE
jgi:hypothetical protein